MADRAFSFLGEHFYDPSQLGWYYLVSAAGSPVDRQKHLYAQSFAIYGLSEYFLAFGTEEALRLGLETFGAIDRFGHDTRWRGYRESFSQEWTPLPQHPDFGIRGNRKTLNTHLHLLESFTSLYRASKDTTVKGRIEELIDVCANTMIDTKRGCAHQFFEHDWTPLPSPASFGHDMELSWLLTEAVDGAAIGNASSIREVSLSLARGVARNGLDWENGGVVHESGKEDTRDRELQASWVRSLPALIRQWLGRKRARERKVWWVQAEALVGFLNAHALSGDQSFLDAFTNVEEWVFAYQVDHQHGEWHKEIASGGRRRGRKGGLWKTPYHTARACMEVIRRLNRLCEAV
jgi:mannobiose 2-epimerase